MPEGGAWAPAAAGIYQKLEGDILDGRLPPGATISEPTLSHRFGVSRAPLREAIWQLEKRGLLIRPPRQRARVVSLSDERIRHLFILRESIEGMAAREAARRIGPDGLGLLAANLRQQQDGEPPGTDFHAIIAQASGNPFLAQVLDDHSGLIELCRRRQRRDPARVLRSIAEHRRILDALEEKDAELAELLMRRHIANARDMVVLTQ